MFDLVYPCHPKDVDTLRIAVRNARKFTTCDNIYVISPEDLHIEGTIHISEALYSEYVTLDGIHTRWMTEDPNMAYRSSWVYQQLLKVYAPRVITNLKDNYLVFDADSIIVRNIDFNPSKFQYCKPTEYHIPYVESYERLMKEKVPTDQSFIAHHMLFNKEIVLEIIGHVESLHGCSFCDAVLSCIDYHELSSVCVEYDLYGNYVASRYPEMMEHRQLTWSEISYIPSDQQMNRLSESYDFVSAHAWMRGFKCQI